MLRHPILSVRPPTTTFASLGLNLEDRQTQLSNDTILPVSIDGERLEQDLPKIFRQAISDECTNVRRDPTLRHFGLTVDMVKGEEAGQFWIIAGGELVLSASSQVPPAEREIWGPAIPRASPWVECQGYRHPECSDLPFFGTLTGDVVPDFSSIDDSHQCWLPVFFPFTVLDECFETGYVAVLPAESWYGLARDRFEDNLFCFLVEFDADSRPLLDPELPAYIDRNDDLPFDRCSSFH